MSYIQFTVSSTKDYVLISDYNEMAYIKNKRTLWFYLNKITKKKKSLAC